MSGTSERSPMLQALVRVASVVNLLLAFNFFPLVPLLGWLNFGRANWATTWIPDAVMLIALPAAYAFFWHFWYVPAGAAIILSVSLWRRSGANEGRLWTALNAAVIAMYLAVRLILALQGVRPDIV
jgi:hypothetical protein